LQVGRYSEKKGLYGLSRCFRIIDAFVWQLESVRNASAPLPLGMKNETRDEHTSTPTTTAEARKKILAKYGFIN
jgi:hypothetical protein